MIYHIYRGLSATISEWKAESDSISGSFLWFTIVLFARRDPDCVQVQRWDCLILGNGDVEPILVAEKFP